MPDPADKSDDLIAELAKLMASGPGGTSGSVMPPSRPAPLNPATTSPQAPAPAAPQPTPIRIPGMDMAPRPAAPTPQPEPRAPLTGSIRIPGMDQPAPVATTAPVGKFDFGGKPVVAPIKQEPLSSFTERLQGGRNLADDGAPKSEAPAPIRIPSDLKPVSENRSFAEGPALAVNRPAPAPAAPATPAPAQTSGSDFHFDFGLTANPQSAAPVRPVAEQRPAPQPAPAVDPIAALIEADLNGGESGSEADEPEMMAEPQQRTEPTRPAVVTPMIRPVPPQSQKPGMAPMAPPAPRPQGTTPIPLKPVSVAPRAGDHDRFAISPGVGLNMKPAATQPLNPQPRAPEPVAEYDDSDPMSEIESLIGEAVRVELTPGPVRVQTPQQVAPKVELEPEAELEREITRHPEPAPVVPPLTTAFAPRRSNIKDDKHAASAEDAILAAAAASGAEVGRIEPAVGDESPYRRLKVKPQRASFLSGGMRQYVGMAVAGTLLLAAGLGLYWVLNMGRSSATATNAPVLTADTTPIKVKPAATPTPTTDSAKSPVLAKMDGASSAPSQEQLVSTDETNGGAVTRDVTPSAAADDSESGLANRKVRTVTVRPDGTIVSGDTALAGGEALPIDRPNVPAVPSTETTNLLGSDTASIPAVDTSATDPSATDATTQVAEAQASIDPNAVAPTPMAFPVRNSAAPLALAPAPKNTSVNAVTDNGGDATGSTDLLGQSKDPLVAAVTPPKKTPVAAPAPASGGSAPAYVQLSSQPSQADAQASVKAMTAKYGSLFGGNSLTVQQVDLGQKGVRWRVRLPAASLSDASNICAQIKAQGGDCFPTKG